MRSQSPVPSLTSLSLLAGAIAVLSCAEPSAPPQPQASVVSTLDHTATHRARQTAGNISKGLVKCAPTASAADTASIGPSGGVLTVGPHTLDIPAGALRAYVTIIAVAPSDTVSRIRFEPAGLVFQKPAALTMSYRNCGLTGSANLRIAYTDDALVIIEYLPSVRRDHKVTGQLDHFSNYAVAW